MAAWTGADGPALIRNYDYVPALCETTALASSFTGRTVVAMADCLWGALDGVNDAGLAIALSFGGRRAVGRGFSIALVVRYLLEVCDDVAGAIKVVKRLPVNLSYNLLLVDRSGDAAVVYLAPDRPPSVSRNGRYAANRQGETEWPDHAEMSETIARESALAEAIDDAAMTRAELERRFLAAPVHRSLELHAWGTVYTASYDTQEPALRLLWPGEEWALPLTEPQESERTLEMPVTFPPLVAREVDVPRSASMIVF
jgi:predicted choloylglycine hydrolase